MKKMRMAIMLVGSTVLFGGVIGFTVFKDQMIKQYFATLPEPVVTVSVEDALTEQWTDVVPAVGTLRAINGVSVSPSLGGIVTAIAFDSGRTVQTGQVLVQLDTSEEESQLASAKAQVALSELAADRAQRLARSSAGTRADRDDSLAQLDISKAKVMEIGALIAKKTILAPFDGTLGVRAVDLGEYVQPGQALVDLQDLSVILADFTVSQKDLSQVNRGATLTMTTDAWPDRTFTGKVSAVAPKVDEKTGMVKVEGHFDNADGALRPGMFARLEARRSESRSVIVVPANAISYSLHGDTLFVVKDVPAEGDKEAAKRVERRVVTIGERRGNLVSIVKGVDAGEPVVITGQLKLQDGTKVTFGEGVPDPVAKTDAATDPAPESETDQTAEAK
ncbi:MAG: efflux RND transporter periplasmic adaptor subunit [Rhodospirillum sp.]|nr:efflux RND transporter periplasmic adaptor subunit [Rhodospirillum sp.]MCF8487611.1 efflux RND transporter periplasmic adaptor subunit [Rhodospirillum sp.]MCF8499215.1 efflux RND transporter periplasmic adaptor subunit [Rhodospirillum sp.]